MDNRRNRSLLAGIGCLVLLLLVILPVGLLYWVFSSGGINIIPQTGQTPFFVPTSIEDTSDLNEPRQLFTPGPTLASDSLEPPAPDTSEGAQSGIEPPNNLADLYEQVSPGTVSILVASGQGAEMSGGMGSGFILSENGYIVTNDHVVEGGDRFIVRFYNDVDAVAEVVGTDPSSDLAVLRVEELAEGARPLPLGDSNLVRVGDSVVAIGNPFGLGTSMSYGIVSAVGRLIPGLAEGFNIPQAIQTDAAINPGNSGGPLLNMRGEVIGVNAQIRTNGTGGGNIGIGFAIPVNILRQVAPALVERGAYTWAYLGVTSAQEQPGLFQTDEAEQVPRGAVIADVVPGGPADEAGLQAGDIVVGVEGQVITGFDELLAYIAFRQPGDQIVLTIQRGDQQQDIPVTLGERPTGGFQQ